MAYDANFSESATFNATFAGNAIDAVSNEVIDIRTAYDGTVYPSAGDAVRSQIEEAMASGGSGVPTAVRSAILTLFESAAYAETGLTDEIAVVQSWASEVTEISLSATTLSLNGSTPQTIVATVVPSSATVAWSSSDTEVATVTGGVVTGVGNGTCIITASAGDKSATCAVTVSGFAVLESISAVYTQSGTVYDTDSLDSLKADLVVTATYSDSTTETITNYVLSGTLAEGTSTIAVTYMGKGTTFNVNVSGYHYVINSTSPNVSFGSYDIAKASSNYKANTNKNRIACLGEDFLGYECEYGYKYIFTVTGATYDTMQMSVAVYNETAKTAVQNMQDSTDTNRYAPGWMTINSTTPIEVTPPQSINGSAPAMMWLTLRKNESNTEFATLSEMGTITITREAVS